MESTGKKSEFIVEWFRREKSTMSFKDQLRLVKAWMDICTEAEEYEMAASLKKEKVLLIKVRIATKKNNRTFRQKWDYFIIKLKRKFK
jgi:hypothetical protein